MEEDPPKITGRSDGGGEQVQGAKVHGALDELVRRTEGEDEDEEVNSRAYHGNLHGAQ